MPPTLQNTALPARRGSSPPRIAALVAAGALFALFAGVSAAVYGGGLVDFDRGLLLALRDPANPANALGPRWLAVAARDVTALGSTAVLTLATIVALGYFALERRWGGFALVFAAIVGGTLVNNTLKALVQRARPDFVAEIAETSTYSFPSGHAFMSAVTFLILGALIARARPGAMGRTFVFAVAVALTLLIGLSRVYLGMHWPSDVLAGWCAGASWALLCLAAADWFGRRGPA
ncbi:phosphatase PAP2 family protein [Rhodomicrobium sp. Az07]|uniref:phosphatase PAP2 family protein n=1 Tax=Rhodomicrobium sp. Az07 TaxID=2839034 RepID=UPI001BE7117C|nr:phosphatase PAP2 family protein [Rhodomicrobium sp. Az07]MBT3070391.1 phosphatase PAP2 family protein [Rhodomicrobium sp. Az07]